ncbi:MAG: YihY/virulence factor BrkB family protein [Thermodesulfovibrionales bacterium]|nr:YihY/virulence factor BrkB family protein [Thermodesulfovibrionales bacterium]
MKYPKIIAKSFVDFFKDGGVMLAGSISYFTMMALMPFCLFLVTIFGYLLGHYHGFYQFFSNKLISFFPAITSEITKELGRLIAFKGIGTFSIVLYGILSYQVFSSLENALNVIFKVKERRNFFWSIILSLIIVTLIIVILLVSFMATSLIPLLKGLKPVFPQLRIGMITGFLIGYVVPFFIVFFTVTVLYILLPKSRVRASHAFMGAFFTTVFLEVAKHLFTWYVGTVARFGTIYGSLTAFVVFLLWVFYSSCIFLIGAEMVHNQGSNKGKRLYNKQ